MVLKDISNQKRLKIKKEKEIETIYKLYIDMIGKKGISKLVLRSVLPIINLELQRLLEDVTDFDVEVTIDDKNDLKILVNKDQISLLIFQDLSLKFLLFSYYFY